MRFSLLIISLFLWSDLTYGQYILPTKGLCAHRGVMINYPENTIPAFLEAIYSGAQMIECDVRFTKDSVLVVIHDSRVDRTTNGTGNVSDFTFEEIHSLDAGIYKGERFKGVKIPTFEQVLSIMPRNIWINCHLKGGPELAVEAAKLIRDQNRTHQAFLACDIESAVAARTEVKDILICNMDPQTRSTSLQYVKSTIDLNADFLQFTYKNKEAITRELTSQAKNNSIYMNFYQKEVLKVDEIKNLFSLGINFPLVNNIDELKEYYEVLGIQPVNPIF